MQHLFCLAHQLLVNTTLVLVDLWGVLCEASSNMTQQLRRAFVRWGFLIMWFVPTTFPRNIPQTWSNIWRQVTLRLILKYYRLSCWVRAQVLQVVLSIKKSKNEVETWRCSISRKAAATISKQPSWAVVTLHSPYSVHSRNGHQKWQAFTSNTCRLCCIVDCNSETASVTTVAPPCIQCLATNKLYRLQVAHWLP